MYLGAGFKKNKKTLKVWMYIVFPLRYAYR